MKIERTDSSTDFAKAFNFWTPLSGKKTDTQLRGTCPLCSKADHFFVDPRTGQWDCKHCGESGNYFTFLRKFHTRCLESTTDADRKRRAKERKLNPGVADSYKQHELAIDGNRWLMPIRNAEGGFANLHHRRDGEKWMSAPGCQQHLLGADKLKESNLETPVYVVEGNDDFIVFDHFLSVQKIDAIVVAVPGCNTSLEKWKNLFQGRDVAFLYDNDQPGRVGQKKQAELLATVAKSLRLIEWPKNTREGFDISDYFSGRKMKGMAAWKTLQKMLKPFQPPTKATPLSDEPPKRKLKPVSYTKCKAVWRKHLYLPDPNLMDVVLGSLAGHHLEGNPLWLFLVGNSGDGKTEVLKTIADHDDVYLLAGLSKNALVSGYLPQPGESDPSLLPRLSGKLVTMLDFTSVLSDAKDNQQAILGTLRLAYDGAAYKEFGTGKRNNVKSYAGKFDILAGVTPIIEKSAEVSQDLGERFIRYHVDPGDVEEKIRRATINDKNSLVIRQELRDATLGFLQTLPKSRPTVPDSIFKRVVRLAKFTAWGRSYVPRDRFTKEIGVPNMETGTRLSTELVRFGLGIAIVRGKRALTWAEYEMIQKAAMDSLPSMRSDIVKALLKLQRKSDDFIRVVQIEEYLNRPRRSLERAVEDLRLLRLLEVKKITEGKIHFMTCRLVPEYREVLQRGKR